MSVVMATLRRVSIQTETIELGALLKWTGLVPTGGEAKRLIQDGRVSVNGRTEQRRGRRLHPGDRVEVGGQAVLIERSGPH
jgi:ribosome-associated protein